MQDARTDVARDHQDGVVGGVEALVEGKRIVAIELLAALQAGDEIVTAGGLYGTVQAIENDEVHVEIAHNVVVRVARRAVAAVLTEKSGTELEAAGPDREEDGTLPSA